MSMSFRIFTLAVCYFAALAALPGAGRAQEQGRDGPELRDFASALLYSVADPHASPAGANDWDCLLTQAHPRPVVLVHGTIENAFNDFAQLSPMLKRAGYCVFAPHYGGYEGTPFRAMTDIPTSARQLSDFIDLVLDAT